MVNKRFIRMTMKKYFLHYRFTLLSSLYRLFIPKLLTLSEIKEKELWVKETKSQKKGKYQTILMVQEDLEKSKKDQRLRRK